MDRRSSWQHATQPQTYCHHYSYFRRFFPLTSDADDTDALIKGASRSSDDLLVLHRKRMPKAATHRRDDPAGQGSPRHDTSPLARDFEGSDNVSFSSHDRHSLAHGSTTDQRRAMSCIAMAATRASSTHSFTADNITRHALNVNFPSGQSRWQLSKSHSSPIIQRPTPVASPPTMTRVTSSMLVSVPEHHQKHRTSSFLSRCASTPIAGPSSRDPAGLLRLIRSPTISSATSSLNVHGFPAPPIPVLRRTKRFSAFWIDANGHTGKRKVIIYPTPDSSALPSGVDDTDSTRLDASLFLFGFVFFPFWWYGLWRFYRQPRPLVPSTHHATAWLTPHRFRQLNVIMAILSLLLLAIIIGLVIWYARVA